MKLIIKCHFWLICCLALCLGYLYPISVSAQPCEEWAGKIVSAQGTVEVRKAGEAQWIEAKLNETFCPGDMVRVKRNSRAAIVLANEALIRLDQNTTIAFEGLDEQKTFLMDMLSGIAHFFSRFPKRLKIKTSFVNAAIEGTEFFIQVETDEALLSIFEGNVLASNAVGSLVLGSGQSAVARAEQAPVLRTIVRPRDAVQWALYYPPIVNWRPADFAGVAEAAWQTMMQRSIGFYWQGNITEAFNALENVPPPISDPRFFVYRASLFLTVGRVTQAQADTSKALQLDPANSQAVALQSIIDVVNNNADRAMELANKAVGLDPKAVTAWVALSYAQQSQFDLKTALKSLEEALKLDPDNALVWARLAELHLSVGELDKSSKAAQRAVKLNPHLAKTQTIEGFALLMRIKINAAKDAFENAIQLDSSAPLPRLGLGLAKIRGGDLKAGRAEIEIAASLDPNNSLIRSYLGKAYFDERRSKLATNQFEIAKRLDPLDPTPWFYDAINKQTTNRPVEALQDIQKSIELNHNRAVYRSRLQLDQDLAARSAGLGRIFNDLGFQQLGLIEGWKSVNRAPSNYSAHRLLSDLYAGRPRHQIAKVSELLQSQLLQPLNITPVQPQLAESNLFVLEGSGPANPSFNEFNPLFVRNRLALQASGVAGNNDTLGDELTQSGIWNWFSYSLGQFYFDTDGFRKNNDFDKKIYNVFSQVSLSSTTSFQGEWRRSDTDNGDIRLRFDPDVFSPTFEEETDIDSFRLGFHHSPAVNSDLIFSFIYTDRDESQSSADPAGAFTRVETTSDVEEDAYDLEAQYICQGERFGLTAGGGYLTGDTETKNISTGFLPPLPPVPLSNVDRDDDIDQKNIYAYSQIDFPANVTWTLGASGDFFDDDRYDRDQFNPKFGITWNPIPSLTFRGAAFRTLKHLLVSNQTLEPTQVAGFNQFFDDVNGTEAWRYGVAADQKFSDTVYGGVEISRRDLDVPIFGPTLEVTRKEDRDEKLLRSYLYWTPWSFLALSAEYQYEDIERDYIPGAVDLTLLTPAETRTHRVPLGINVFHPSGLSLKMQATYFDHEVDFPNLAGGVDTSSEHFWIADVSLGYRLPKRYGIASLTVKNLFDEDINFQDTDLAGEPRIPSIQPDRSIFASVTLSF